MDTPTTKRCSKCGQEKPLSEFTNNVTQADGKDYYCRECRSQVKRERRNKESAQALIVQTQEGGGRTEQGTCPNTDSRAAHSWV